jgi:hypothetical protein
MVQRFRYLKYALALRVGAGVDGFHRYDKPNAIAGGDLTAAPRVCQGSPAISGMSGEEPRRSAVTAREDAPKVRCQITGS